MTEPNNMTENSENEIEVGRGDIQATNTPKSCLVSKDLASGVAVVVYDPQVNVAGILHFLLPRHAINEEKAVQNPALFADTGIPQLFRRCYKLGAKKERMSCYVVGGADVLDSSGAFAPGLANTEAAVDVLAQNDVQITDMWIGGRNARHTKVFTSAGQIEVLPEHAKYTDSEA